MVNWTKYIHIEACDTYLNVKTNKIRFCKKYGLLVETGWEDVTVENLNVSWLSKQQFILLNKRFGLKISHILYSYLSGASMNSELQILT